MRKKGRMEKSGRSGKTRVVVELEGSGEGVKM